MTSLYNRYFLPCLLDCACATKPIRKQRGKIIPLAKGDVVEIGIGSGLNLPFYDQTKVSKLIGIDPDEYVWKKSKQRREAFERPIERLGLSGESIPLEDDSADTVVVTYSLCTIPDPVKALREMGRILKPGGDLLFTEHGMAPDAKVHKWQNRIDKVWKNIAGGCHSGRPIPDYFPKAGLKLEKLDQRYIPGPKVLSYNYWGIARNA